MLRLLKQLANRSTMAKALCDDVIYSYLVQPVSVGRRVLIAVELSTSQSQTIFQRRDKCVACSTQQLSRFVQFLPMESNF
jgi:hypothetical protein